MLDILPNDQVLRAEYDSRDTAWLNPATEPQQGSSQEAQQVGYPRLWRGLDPGVNVVCRHDSLISATAILLILVSLHRPRGVTRGSGT